MEKQINHCSGRFFIWIYSLLLPERWIVQLWCCERIQRWGGFCSVLSWYFPPPLLRTALTMSKWTSGCLEKEKKFSQTWHTFLWRSPNFWYKDSKNIHFRTISNFENRIFLIFYCQHRLLWKWCLWGSLQLSPVRRGLSTRLPGSQRWSSRTHLWKVYICN